MTVDKDFNGADDSLTPAIEVVQHLEQLAEELGLPTLPRLGALPLRALPEVVVLGREAKMPILQFIALGVEAGQGRIWCLDREPGRRCLGGRNSVVDHISMAGVRESSAPLKSLSTVT